MLWILHDTDLRGSLKHVLLDAEGITPPSQLLLAVLQSICKLLDDGRTLVDEARVLALETLVVLGVTSAQITPGR
jgi:hypothetical protein